MPLESPKCLKFGGEVFGRPKADNLKEHFSAIRMTQQEIWNEHFLTFVQDLAFSLERPTLALRPPALGKVFFYARIEQLWRRQMAVQAILRREVQTDQPSWPTCLNDGMHSPTAAGNQRRQELCE